MSVEYENEHILAYLTGLAQEVKLAMWKEVCTKSPGEIDPLVLTKPDAMAIDKWCCVLTAFVAGINKPAAAGAAP